MESVESIGSFYTALLPGAKIEGQFLTAPCPFCEKQQAEKTGKIAVVVNPDSFFLGYFRCLNRCTPGGFHIAFAKHMGIDMAVVPGFDPEREPYINAVRYPLANMNKDVEKFQRLMDDDQFTFFRRFGISQGLLAEMRVGFNGRYLIYPYIQDNGNSYAFRCVMPGVEEDNFWRGDETFFGHDFNIFNVMEIDRCENGAIFITEGELNLLTIRELGYPGIAVPSAGDLEHLDSNRFSHVNHVFLLVNNSPEALLSARDLARRIGFKARILTWPEDARRDLQLHELAEDKGKAFKKIFSGMIRRSKAFSPFSTPEVEHRRIIELIEKDQGKEIVGFKTGFEKLDRATDGIRGINVMGGPPKAGKSCFFMQISTEMARHKAPVIYYDFENGRQKIYMRTLTRLTGMEEKAIRTGQVNGNNQNIKDESYAELEKILHYFRVVTDRKLSPDIMLSHIEFLKHETRSDRVLVVLDSLHKLPFKNLSDRRTGIDSWLRHLEAIRDEENAAFMVISELSRDREGRFSDTPHLGSFKASGDIAYSADNAMVLVPDWNPMDPISKEARKSTLWMVASRENSPGKIAEYALEYPYWRFREC